MASENTVVRVKQGELRGIIEETDYGDQYLAFRGIPYAKPPIGPLRFKVNSFKNDNHDYHEWNLYCYIKSVNSIIIRETSFKDVT